MRAYSKSGSPDKLLKILSKMPFLAHRRKRRNTVFQHPKIPGKSPQGAPVRTIHKTASRKRRLSAAVRPRSPGFPGKFGAIRSYCSSLNSIRSKADPHFFSLKITIRYKRIPPKIKCPQPISWLLKGRNRGFILWATLERVPLPGNSHNERFIVPNFV